MGQGVLSSSKQILNKVLEPLPGKHNVLSYPHLKAVFSWEKAGHALSYRKTGQLNAAYETIDRHVHEGYGHKTALHFVDDTTYYALSYSQVHHKINQYAWALKQQNVEKGDPVFIFLPKNPACYAAILAVIKIGAIAVPLFEAFMEEAVKDRINDCQGKVIITDRDLVQRVQKHELPFLETVLYADEIEADITAEQLTATGDLTEWVTADDGLIIHYTSGSTGKPKGVVLTHRAVVHHYETGKFVLDIQEEDIYWCTSHPGWVTGSVYGLFAPWLNRATIVIHGGRFSAESWYQTIQDLGVTILYSAPTAYRMLLSEGDLIHQYELSSLRHVLSVGEPLNPEVIYWAWETLGVRIHDTWWMTETGGHLIVNLPTEKIKPGSMGRPFPGIQVGILDSAGNELPRNTVGQLAIKTPWPGLLKEIWKNPVRHQAYFQYPGWYLSGDLAYQDEEGYVFFQSRDDDIIVSAGERIGPFEVESKLIEHPAVAEAAAVGKPDKIRGEVVKAFVTLRPGFTDSVVLREEIRLFVRNHLAAHAAPREIEVVEELPKTVLSGKILRRELKNLEVERAQGTGELLQKGA